MSDSENTNRVVVAGDGPLCFEGELRIDGAAADRSVALCRCGESKNKPLCDGSHEQAGFSDPGAVEEGGPGSESEGGPLEIKRAPNGPLLLKGDLTIVTGSGRPAWRGTKAALCRCGKSQNKPFCDGAHKAAGFEAD